MGSKTQFKQYIVAITGGGGREHALAEAYAKSTHVQKILIVPGNDFIKYDIERRYKKPVEVFTDTKIANKNYKEEFIRIVSDENVTFVDVAHDNAVAMGIADETRALGIPTIGPTQAAGRIEWDKAWLREMGKKWGLPQPKFFAFTDAKDGISYLKKQPDQAWFVKASGLAEGKGALPAENNTEAIARISELKKRFRDAAETIILEEWMRNADGSSGEEFSYFVLSDGDTWKVLGNAMDYKRVFDHDEGENTGSMGSNSPTTLLTTHLKKETEQRIVKPVIAGLQKIGISYEGIIYVSGMVLRDKKGKQRVMLTELNARFGDPEAQVILPNIKTDWFTLCYHASQGRLQDATIKTDTSFRVIVAIASRGYPGDVSQVKGKRIYGINDVQQLKRVSVYGAGIKRENGVFVVNGGRVVYVVGEGQTLSKARERAYAAASHISFAENLSHMRTDIGYHDVLRSLY